MIYCFDTSAFLDAAIRHYPPDNFPTFWVRLDELAADVRLISHEHVLDELKRKEEDVAYDWAREHPAVFEEATDETETAMARIMSEYPELVKERKGLRNYADPFVIAVALVRTATVVTGEKPTGSLSRPKIPDVCHALDIACVSLLQVIRNERWRF